MAILGTWRTTLRTKLWYMVCGVVLPMWLMGKDWPFQTVTCSGPLYWDWTERLLRFVVRWSEMPESASHGSWLLVMAALDALAIATSFVGGCFPW